MSVKLKTKEDQSHYETYVGFIRFLQISSAIVAIILALMAIFLI
tara:strand:- start:466 stop:597 length:132 start_codon:yes stop_codon:yes gene_type:complete